MCRPLIRVRTRGSVFGHRILAFVLVLVAALPSAVPVRAVWDDADWVMYHDPQLPAPRVEQRFQPGLLPLWLQALERPERTFKRQAAAAIAEAHQKGLGGLDAAVPHLLRLLEDPEQDRAVRLTVAHSLVTLDARQAADGLLAGLRAGDLDLAEIVEPALARWSHPGARRMWMERLAEDDTFLRSQVLAIRGLAAAGETAALPRLIELAVDPHRPPGTRLEAADAVGRLQSAGLEAEITAKIADKSPRALVQRLVAAKMLHNHRGESAERILAELAEDPAPSVQTIALEQLLRIDPQLVVPVTIRTLNSADAAVRRLSAETLIAVAQAADPEPQHVASLSALMDDPHPELRRMVREELEQLASHNALRDAVIEQGRRVLSGDGWRGQEQATRLLVALDDTTIVDRLLELLDSPRPEAHTTAAWGLCRLRVPATAEPILKAFEAKTNHWIASASRQAGTDPVAGTDIQLAHLAQALGRLKHAPADAVLREYVPKFSPLPMVSRAASVWALGHLGAEDPDADLAELLKDCLIDVNPPVQERPLVRRMAAVSLARMRAIDHLPSLRAMLARDTVQVDVGIACAWAIEQLTGEPIPEIRPEIVRDRWFLVPIE